jgi:hypothetical protein
MEKEKEGEKETFNCSSSPTARKEEQEKQARPGWPNLNNTLFYLALQGYMD